MDGRRRERAMNEGRKQIKKKREQGNNKAYNEELKT
jgi:hypothetical protein